MAKQNWREGVLYALSYCQKKARELISEMADTLHKKKDHNAAAICYMLSHQVEKVAEIWRSRTESAIKKHPESRDLLLFNFLKKVTYLRIATGDQSKVDSISDMIAQVCEIIASEGEPALAMKYLQTHHYSSQSAMELAHRIYNSVGAGQFDASIRPP